MKSRILKHIQILILLFPFIGKCYSQNIDKSLVYFSVEPFFNYPYYNTLEKYQNYTSKLDYNYGGGIFIALNTSKVTFKSGCWYSTKEYYDEPNYFWKTVEKIDYHIDYFNIPLIWSFRINNNIVNNNQFHFSAGVIFNIPDNYRSITHYSNGKVVSADLPYYKKTGIALRLGFRYTHNFTNHWSLFSDVYCDLKIVKEYNEYVPSPMGGVYAYNLPDDRILSGINIGIAYSLKNTGKFLKWLRENKGNEQQ